MAKERDEKGMERGGGPATSDGGNFGSLSGLAAIVRRVLSRADDPAD